MKIENILEVEQELKRFSKRLKDLKDSQNIAKTTGRCTFQSKETGALKRSSMDLSRSLSKMRNELY
jgi:predicted  nucleic acid-binding Zn-ribbon protein